MGDDKADLQTVLDERAILRTMHRYCRALDDGIEDEWAEVFTEDAVFDTVLPNGEVWVHLTTPAEFAAFLAAYPRRPATRPKHVMVDPVIELDGDEARAESSWLFLHQKPGAKPQLEAWGRYRDRFRNVDGHWRIAERIAETEAMEA